jgi:predicted DCC family thiol-disulfide oxidoreductase YuxK
MEDDRAVVLFDGECNLCNGSVNFLIDRDAKGKLLFASQQSPVGEKFMRHHGIVTNLDTLAMVHQGRVYLHSTAVIRTIAHMGGVWRPVLAFLLVPAVFRDFCYARVAGNRYRFFGRKAESCRVFTPDTKRRFLQFNEEARDRFVPKDD